MALFLLFRLTAFHRKTDAYLIALILNAEGSEIKGFGFSFLNSSPRVLRGIQGYVAIFCYPNDLVVSFNVRKATQFYSVVPPILIYGHVCAFECTCAYVNCYLDLSDSDTPPNGVSRYCKKIALFFMI